MANASQIREIIANYVSKGDAEKFVRDFSAASYNIHQSGDAEAVELAQKAIGKMSDLYSGCISISAFRDRLCELALAPVQAPYEVPQIVTGSNNFVFISQGFVAGLGAGSAVRFAGIPRALVSAS